MTDKEFNILLNKTLNDTITKEEEALLIAYEEKAIQKTEKYLFLSDLEKKEIKKTIYKGVRKKIKPNYFFKLAIASSIILFLGFSTFLFFNHKTDVKVLAITNISNQIKTILLEDGSTVVLNKNSSLKYINTFNNTRHLDLKGEAFFKIKRNEKKPFIVKTKNIETKVLGTSFNILNKDSLVSISVATGLVQVSDANNVIFLKPNQQTTYKIASQSFITKNKSHKLFTTWFKDVSNLKNVYMSDLEDYIKDNYNTEVSYSNINFKNVKMSITINRNESLKSLIHKINYITDLKLTYKKNNMIEVK